MTRRDLFKATLAGAITPLAGATGDSAVLAGRASRYRELILDVAKGPGGMIIAFLPADTRRPFQEGEPMHWYLVRNLHEVWGTVSPRPTTAEWYYGENTLWATGWLLYSQILRYRATGNPEARATAQKCFRDLSNVFRLCRAIEPGLLGKPHGGRAGPTTSYDQAACPVIFYTQYANELGSPEERAEAAANMAQHGEYYLRHKWVMNHHGHLQDIVKAGHTSLMKYLACEYAAYQMTGETRFRDEALRHLRSLIRAGRLPWPSHPYETNHNLYYYALLCDFWLQSEFASEFDWRGAIRQYWQAQQTTFAADGLPQLGNYDARNRSFTPYPTVWSADRRWQSATLYSNGGLIRALAAGLGLLAQSHGLDDEAHRAARNILLRMDEGSLRWWWGKDERFPADLRPELNIFATEVAGAWQIAYWMGRLQKVW